MTFDQTKAFEAVEGFIVESGAGIFSGSISPVGSDAPSGSLYMRTNGEIWRKFDSGSSDWVLVEQLSGQVLPGSFSGNPKTATITFPYALPTNNYSPTFESADGRIWIAESMTTTGFIVNSQAGAALTNILYWTAKFNF